MSEHRAVVRWRNAGTSLEYGSFSRDHEWDFEGGPRVPASAAAAYLGAAGRVDPEEALVASASACHMLTFLAIASKKKLVVASYEDTAVGHLERDGEGRLAVTRIELHPAVTFAAGTTVTAGELGHLHDSAHRNCFIANSIRSQVTVIPR
jgi:organic hydroperoxide reductase OsmC/OhrA